MSSLISWILYQNTLLFYFINNSLNDPFLNFLMPAITNFGSFIAMGIICVLLYIFGGENTRKVALMGLAALLLANVAVYLLKIIVAEPRPFVVLPHVIQLVSESEAYGFPSGHAASSFSVMMVIGLKYRLHIKGKTYRLLYPLLAFASLIAFSRVYIGVHYPLDVIFGAIVGILSALVVIYIGWDEDIVNKISKISIKDMIINIIRGKPSSRDKQS
ncbi:phosphatase PAP2 family protein [Methanobacterium sp.]|uniref:phosphatase PAP2 family protein n=1 Tax=Methanobacterium sp. TaxID=2164 RepID=UPI003C796C58